MKLTREEARVILKVEVRLGRLKHLLIKARVGQCCRTCQCPGLLPVFFLGRRTAPWRGGAAGVPRTDLPNLPVSWPAAGVLSALWAHICGLVAFLHTTTSAWVRSVWRLPAWSCLAGPFGALCSRASALSFLRGGKTSSCLVQQG